MPVAVSRPRALSAVEIERVRAKVPTARDALLVSLMAYCGLRPGEAFALRWADVGQGAITVSRAVSEGELRQPKTNRARVIETIRPVARELEKAQAAGPAGTVLVCPGELGGPLDARNWSQRVWRPAAAAAKVTGSPYDLRHSFASLALGSGVNPLLVASQMGHATAATTFERYAHVLADAKPGISMTEAIESARRDVRRLHAVR